MEKLLPEEKRVLARIQGYKTLTFEEIINFEFAGCTFKAKRILGRLVNLGYLSIVGLNGFSYTGKEVEA